MTQSESRRQYSLHQLGILREQLATAASLTEDKACLFVTGSFGRLEGCQFSDLDVFLVGKVESEENHSSRLRPLDEICFKAELIKTVRRLNFPDFTGDGRYLTQFTDFDFIRNLGTPKDDATNILTARLLLLLESQPLVGETVYNEVLSHVIAAYWRDYPDHSSDFLPTFLANDILRLWRTFCVNYEARTERQPVEKKAKGKLKNYKLKHSRLLTCYSALAYLLGLAKLQGTVSPQDALAMIRLSPVDRLSWLSVQAGLESSSAPVSELLDYYERFLATTHRHEDDLIALFLDKTRSSELLTQADEFGEAMFRLLLSVGSGHRFLRYLLV